MTFKKVQIVRLPTTDKIYTKYHEFLSAQIGKNYDWAGIMGFITSRDWRNDDKWFCSEIVAAGLEESGYFNYLLSNTSNKISPSDLLLACSVKTNIYDNDYLV